MILAALVLLATRGGTPPPSPVRRFQEAAPEIARPVVAEKRWALCVGAGAYTDLAPLKYSPNDARAFAGVLREGYGFEGSTVGLLADGAEKPPTSANVLGELDRLLADRRLDRGDLFVFYFSGHGVGKPGGDYLMPTDVAERDAETKAIPVRDVISRFVRAGLKNVLVIADACRSGAQNPFGRELQELGRKANVAVLLGCAPGQRSYEYPRLEKGVFTHFLVRAMGDRKLADAGSGALWASAVAAKTAANVREYTEADYGEDAQTPAVWSEPSQDVLLAAYPPKDDEETKAALARAGADLGAGKIDRAAYGRYLSTMGRTLNEVGRPLEAIAALKTLDGLGLATWRDLSVLATILRGEERDNEIASIVARAVREPTPTEQSEFVVLQGQANYVGPERYRRAMDFIFRPETYGFLAAQVRVLLSRARLGASDASIAKDLAPYVPLFSKESPQGLFLGANVALGEGRNAEALALAERLEAQAGSDIPRWETRQIRWRAVQNLNDEARMEAIIAEGEADSGDPSAWTTRRFERMRARKDPGLLDAARALAAKTDSDSRLTETLVALGPDAGELLPDAERLAKLHPYSWQAPVNVWLARAAKDGFPGAGPMPEAASKYAPDRADLVRWAVNRYDDMLERGVRAGRIGGWRAAEARRSLAARYAENWKWIEGSPVALMGFARILMRGAEPIRGSYFNRAVLWPYAQKQEYVGQELRTTCLFLAMNGGDDEAVREIFARLERDGELSPRAIVRYAIYSALRSDDAEVARATKLWDGGRFGMPDAAVSTYFAACRALVAAKAGEKDAAEALLGTIDRADPVALMLAYQARYEMADAKGISLEWVKLLSEPVTDFSDVRIAGLVRMAEGYAAMGAAGKATAATVSTVLSEYPAHPWVRGVGFAGVKGIPAYGGITRWRGTFSDGIETIPVTMSLAVRRDGKVLGAITLGGGEGTDANTISLDGEVDAFGNLAADMGSNELKEGENYIGGLAMKLPPTGFDKTPKGAETDFQATLLKMPHEGFTMTLRCFESRPLAQVEAGAKGAADPPKTPPGKPKPKGAGKAGG